jgi:hypothetical protein
VPITDEEGTILGRASPARRFLNEEGIIVDGGFRVCKVEHLAGVIMGTVTNAARNKGEVFISTESMKRWADGQAKTLRKVKNIDDDDKLEMAAVVGALGASTGSLAIVRRGRDYWSSTEFRKHLKTVQSLFLIRDGDLNYDDEDECSSSQFDDDFDLSSSVFV